MASTVSVDQNPTSETGFSEDETPADEFIEELGSLLGVTHQPTLYKQLRRLMAAGAVRGKKRGPYNWNKVPSVAMPFLVRKAILPAVAIGITDEEDLLRRARRVAEEWEFIGKDEAAKGTSSYDVDATHLDKALPPLSTKERQCWALIQFCERLLDNADFAREAGRKLTHASQTALHKQVLAFGAPDTKRSPLQIAQMAHLSGLASFEPEGLSITPERALPAGIILEQWFQANQVLPLDDAKRALEERRLQARARMVEKGILEPNHFRLEVAKAFVSAMGKPD